MIRPNGYGQEPWLLVYKRFATLKMTLGMFLYLVELGFRPELAATIGITTMVLVHATVGAYLRRLVRLGHLTAEHRWQDVLWQALIRPVGWALWVGTCAALQGFTWRIRKWPSFRITSLFGPKETEIIAFERRVRGNERPNHFLVKNIDTEELSQAEGREPGVVGCGGCLVGLRAVRTVSHERAGGGRNPNSSHH